VFEHKLKFALIGCGYIGKRYITILSQHPQCELTALVDTNCEELETYQHLNIPSFHSVDAYFDSNVQSEVVIVATPNATHASIATASLKQNKHVLIEKPMALERSDAEAIIQTAKDRNKKAMVVLQNRFSQVSTWLKQLLESKQPGKIFFVQVNCFWNRDERYYKKDSWHGMKELDGGSLFTQFSHFIDTVYWLFGDIKNISSRFQNFNHKQLIEFEDTGSIHFEFEQGGMGCISFSTAVWDKSFESSMTIIAENGTVKISGQYMDRIEYCHIKDYSLQATANVSAADNHYKMIDAFVNAIRKNGSTNAEEAMHSIDIIERMYAAAGVKN
jgi:UDP-N-acetyl-2-amino-2-deoxyglucuronate dehydrogenase